MAIRADDVNSLYFFTCIASSLTAKHLVEVYGFCNVALAPFLSFLILFYTTELTIADPGHCESLA